MKKTNYFVEGLQGAGKTTLVRHLSESLKGFQTFREGDYSPVELAWCAWVTQEQYRDIEKSYPSLRDALREWTVEEEDHRIICYTRILTDIPDFHRNLEKYEIYNGNMDRASFESLIFKRYGSWNGQRGIFECSLFQNIIENQLLYFLMTEDEILDFYRKLKEIINDKPYKIIYLDVDDIPGCLEQIRKERSDDQGNELWLPLMLRYLEESPCGKKYAWKGLQGLIAHLEKRRHLERRILDEVFGENSVVFRSRHYTCQDIEKLTEGDWPEE